MKYLLTFLFLTISSLSAATFPYNQFEALAIQDRGRVKPLHTFAKESTLFITGKSRWENLSPVDFIWTMLLSFETTLKDKAFIKVDHKGLKAELGLEKSNYYSLEDILDNSALRTMMAEVTQKQLRNEKLTEIEKKANELANKVSLVQSIISGDALAILPNPQGGESGWFPMSALSGATNAPLPYDQTAMTELFLATEKMVAAHAEGNQEKWKTGSEEFVTTIKTRLAPNLYPSKGKLSLEIHYNKIHPFRFAWILYTLALAFLVAATVSKKELLQKIGLGFLLAGFALHIYGFVLRCLIAGRPPVSNMYESIIWVTFGCVGFSLLIWRFYKNLVIPASSLVFAIAGLILADSLPAILDASIQPLEPVLRSNFWLTIHVLTITLSYSAFALSLCLGNVVLLAHITKGTAERIQTITLYAYRAIQIGVILLAAGTVLGGVWAAYSWGRFWGWDPKEVWALIALLLYLAVLHGRYAGWLTGFRFVVATILSFLGVLMAWYGVNFVLGAGLHSYGFGTGGLQYVLIYIALQIGFIFLARHSSKK